jgi:hypothetical protein
MLRNNNGGAQPSTLERSTIVLCANPQFDQILVKFEKKQVAEVRAQRGDVGIDEAVIDGKISKLTMEYEVNLKLEKLRVLNWSMRHRRE